LWDEWVGGVKTRVGTSRCGDTNEWMGDVRKRGQWALAGYGGEGGVRRAMEVISRDGGGCGRWGQLTDLLRTGGGHASIVHFMGSMCSLFTTVTMHGEAWKCQ